METGESNNITPKSNKKYYIDTVNLKVPRPGTEMGVFLKEGMGELWVKHYSCCLITMIPCAVEDWDMFENTMDYIYKKLLQSDSPEHPVLMSEPAVSVYLLNSIIILDRVYLL